MNWIKRKRRGAHKDPVRIPLPPLNLPHMRDTDPGWWEDMSESERIAYELGQLHTMTEVVRWLGTQ
jgi:hypothetical protein